jgi:hypothetical protein
MHSHTEVKSLFRKSGGDFNSAPRFGRISKKKLENGSKLNHKSYCGNRCIETDCFSTVTPPSTGCSENFEYMKSGYNTQSNISNKWDNLIWLREEAHILMFGSSAFFTAAPPVVKPSRFTAPRTTSTELLLTPKPLENPCKTLPRLQSLVKLRLLLLRTLGARMTLRITRRWSMWTAVADTYTQIRHSRKVQISSTELCMLPEWSSGHVRAEEGEDWGNDNSFERSFCVSWWIQVAVASFYSCL